MDAILKRSKTQYILCVRKEFINNFKSSLDTTYGWVVADEYGGDILKLSLKNCQAIACGYDLDELAYTLANKEYTYEKHLKSAVSPLKIGFKQGFKSGFQKALEILGDKKFSEEDMSTILVTFLNDIMNMKYRGNEVSIINQLLQSLQQIEWDCVIFVDEKTKLPLLDNEGNLILKRR